MPGLRHAAKKNRLKDQRLLLQTEHGMLAISRNMGHCWRCGKLFGDLDAILGLSNSSHRMTSGFRETLAFVGQASASFNDAREILLKLQGIEISATQIQIITEEIGAAVFVSDVKEAASIFAAPERHIPCVLDKDKAPDILYILLDGSAVNTRVQDEDGSTWKEMKLGMVFRSKDVIKRRTQLESCTITNKEYVAYFGEASKFKEQLFAAAVRAGYGTVKNVVVIADGAHWIWNICDECFPDATQILDFYHMAENVHDYARALYPNNDIKKTQWAHEVIGDIKAGRFQEAINNIVNSPINEDAVKKTVNLHGYLENNKDRVRYDQFDKNGYYIASGMIEGGNKVVIQKRMKQCGMRWSVNGGQFVAALRAKKQSNRWYIVKRLIYNMKAA